MIIIWDFSCCFWVFCAFANSEKFSDSEIKSQNSDIFSDKNLRKQKIYTDGVDRKSQELRLG